jgi:pimeloyl-ACP methyl ester carboxylesterase
MPFVFLTRALFSLISLAVLAAGIAVTWRWYRENAYFTEDGHFMVLRADWPIWLGLFLLILSFGGRWFWLLVLARPSGSKQPLQHTGGTMVQSTTGDHLFVGKYGNAEGRPLLLVHGSSLDSSVWGYARDAFRDYHVIVFDLPGLAKSRKAGKVTMTRMAEDLQVLIEQQKQAPVLVGHSMGGMIIQTLARNRPDLFDGTRIAGVVLLNTTYTNPLKTMILARLLTACQPLIELFLQLQIWLLPLTWLSAWQSYLSGTAHIANRFTFGKNVTRRELDRVTLISTRNSPAVIAEGELSMLRWDATDALQQSLTPVLIVAGRSDPVTKPVASEYLDASSQNAKLVIVDGANHMSFLDKAPDYHRVIAEFLNEVR